MAISRVFILFFGLALYAVLGSPTPDDPNWVEVLVGVSLLTACGVGGVYFVFQPRDTVPEPLWAEPARVLALTGLSLPVFSALMNGNGSAAIFRDIVAFCFILVPLFLFPIMTKSDGQQRKRFVFVLIFVGVIFSARALQDVVLSIIGSAQNQRELHYFANVPTVLFAALLMLGTAARDLWRPDWLKNIPRAGFLMFLSALPLAAMMMAVQRASLAGVALSLLALLVIGFILYPARALRVLLMIGGLCVLIWPLLADLYALLSHKTLLVGVNMRGQELLAVWNEVTQNPVRLLIGTGWGGTFHSPAVGGLEVNFTHNFLSSMLLKTGIVGLAAMTWFLGALIRPALRVFFHDPVLAVAMIMPLLINIFLYASYKSLDFGLLLLLLVITAHSFRDNGPYNPRPPLSKA